MSEQELQALRDEVEALKANNAKLNATNNAVMTSSGIRLVVSKKGAFSAYNMQKWPVTLYRKQWKRLLGDAQEILDALDRAEGLVDQVETSQGMNTFEKQYAMLRGNAKRFGQVLPEKCPADVMANLIAEADKANKQ